MKPTKKRVIAGVAALTMSAAGLSWLSQEEGRRYVAYLDTNKVWTICDGHTGRASGTLVKRGDKATDELCDKMLREDLVVIESAVRRCIRVPITQGQFDALVVFSFNVGPGAFCGSTLVKKLNAGDCLGAAKEFIRWRHGGAGLIHRRKRERLKFEEDC